MEDRMFASPPTIYCENPYKCQLVGKEAHKVQPVTGEGADKTK